ncbi:MAG: hypothetical protein LUE27_01025 [Clostridia bacterium]|nr:hypothetical protein [Clostridia bacterium]
MANHAFVDGNKRTGVQAMLAFARVNGMALRYTDRDIVWLGFSMADGSLDYAAVPAWVRGAEEPGNGI